jgi:hypothetical protein
MVRQTPVTNHNVNALKVHPYNADSVFRCGREHIWVLSAQIEGSSAAVRMTVRTSRSAGHESSPPAALFSAADLVRSDLMR